jgi:hypothetical protein
MYTTATALSTIRRKSARLGASCLPVSSPSPNPPKSLSLKGPMHQVKEGVAAGERKTRDRSRHRSFGPLQGVKRRSTYDARFALR